MFKLNSSLMFLLALLVGLVLSAKVAAIGDNGLVLDAELQDANSMTWHLVARREYKRCRMLILPKKSSHAAPIYC